LPTNLCRKTKADRVGFRLFAKNIPICIMFANFPFWNRFFDPGRIQNRPPALLYPSMQLRHPPGIALFI